MYRYQLIRLGALVGHRALQITGVVCKRTVLPGKVVIYGIQPNGLDKAGRPLDQIQAMAVSLDWKKEDEEETFFPADFLDKPVQDKITGFLGVGVYFLDEYDGRRVLAIKPVGLSEVDGKIQGVREFPLDNCQPPA